MHIYKSICGSIPTIHREGYVFILAFLLLTIILGLIWEPLFWVGLILTAWCALFFRDPQRVTPKDKNLIISPADGQISWVGPAVPPVELGLGMEEMQKISIFMNVFNVHVNRAPVAGKVESIRYRAGKFEPADLDKASENNERNGLVLDTEHGKIGVVQVAGLVARRILCWTKENMPLEAGERFGFIRFGSRVDLYLPMTIKIRVGVGQQAIGGETILASFKGEDSVSDFLVS